MKLQVPFVQLPLKFDAARLRAEINALGESVWRPHPQGYAGNSALPLISVDGDPQSDSISGPMRPTPHLEACPYLRQVLAHIGAVWGRSRLMRLSGHAEVPRHADLAYYWRDRMRVHVPIQTQPSVRFQCGEAEVNMAEGECWIFDTWAPHRVINANPDQRIHLVADTVGSERFWQHASGGLVAGRPVADWRPHLVPFNATGAAELVYESENLGNVMTPWELREHLNFLVAEAAPVPQLAAIQPLFARFSATWLGLWAQHGVREAGWPAYRAALDSFNAEMQRLGEGMLLRNGMRFLGAFRAMIVQAALTDQRNGGLVVKGDYDPDAFATPSTSGSKTGQSMPPMGGVAKSFDRPVVVLSPPRSGSTLLFETLARARNVFTVGDESHVQIEGMHELHPAARNFESNALGADQATDAVVAQLHARFAASLRDREGTPPTRWPVRFLEKTPKNALRIPFLRKVFPDAHFVYLYRDPREVLSSMIEAWSSGKFRTYPKLPGWSGPAWSLLLVPDWQKLIGKALHEIVAGQWQTTTQVLLDDLADVPADRVHRIDYDALLSNPDREMRRLCAQVGFEWDQALDGDLPQSKHTHSAPAAEKWRRHEAEIDSVWHALAPLAARAEAAFR